MGAEWVSAALPYVGGGVLGSAVTYSLSWVREHRRMIDAYRAPQRQAIADIITSTNALVMREYEQRQIELEQLGHLRKLHDRGEVPYEQRNKASEEVGLATLSVEQAFRLGRLTIVDAWCLQAVLAAQQAFIELRLTWLKDNQSTRTDTREQQTEGTPATVAQLRKHLGTLTKVGAERLAPTQSWRNRRERRRFDRRTRRVLGTAALSNDIQPPDAPPPSA